MTVQFLKNTILLGIFYSNFIQIKRMTIKLNHILVGCILLIIFSCANRRMSPLKDNFSGFVYEHKFNNMPMLDKPSSKGSPLMTTLYIYEPTKTNEVQAGMVPGPLVSKINTKLLDSVKSDSKGAFSKYLQPGKYSVFIKYENGYYIPFYAGKDWVSIIEVKQNEVTTMDFDVRGTESVQ
jgi:hypothetical protein